MLCEILQWCSRAQVDARPGCVKYYSGAHTSQVDARPGCGGHEQQLPPVARAASAQAAAYSNPYARAVVWPDRTTRRPGQLPHR